MSGKIPKYEHKMKVTFCYLNPEGTLSHDQYATIFGIVRELFGLEYFPNFKEEVGKKYLLATSNASYQYRRPFFFADTLNVQMWVAEVGDTHFTLRADYVNDETREIHGKGEQKIVYTDLRGRPQPIPEEMRSLLRAAQY